MTSDVPRADPPALTPAADDLGVVPDQTEAAVERARALRSLVDLSGCRPLRVVVEADARTAHTLRAVLGAGTELVAVIEPAHLRDLGAAVVEHGADLGLAVDEETGRCVVVDELGDPVSPSATAAVVGLREVTRELRAGRTPTVVHDLLTSRAVPDLLGAAGARTVRAPAGRSAVATQVAAHDAVYGADNDGHHVFRDVPVADGGLLAALHVLAALGGQAHALSTLAELYQPYVTSGEISSRVSDVAAARARVAEAYVEQRGGGPVDVDELDGLTVSHWDGHPQWWFTVRASTAEPLVRLTVEAADEDMMVKVRDDVLALVRSDEEI